MVSSDENSWWKAFAQNVQPGHVEQVRDRPLACNGHAPAEGLINKQHFRHNFSLCKVTSSTESC